MGFDQSTLAQTHGATSKDGGWTIQTGNGHWQEVGKSSWWNGLGLAAGAFFRSPQAKALADQAKNYGKTAKPDPAPFEELWSDHTALDWGKLVSEETRAATEALKSAGDGLDGATSGGNGLTILLMISPSAMGCAGYGNLPCGNGHATSF
jgi:hypothetical protein